MTIENEDQVKLKVYADIDEAREYYHILQTKYAHRRWTPEGREHVMRQDAINNWRKNGVSVAKDSPTGYAITPHMSDDVCPPYPLTTRNLQHQMDTELIFGFADRLLKKLPMVTWASVTEMSPGLEILPHSDWGPGWRTIHLPLYSPEGSMWRWYYEGSIIAEEHFPADGSIWSLDTHKYHGVMNNSNETRVHLLMIVEEQNLEALYSVTGKI